LDKLLTHEGLGRLPQAWRKVMAAYRRVDGSNVTCGLTACTPGLPPGLTFGITSTGMGKLYLYYVEVG